MLGSNSSEPVILPAALAAFLNWTRGHKGTLNDTTSPKLLKLRMVLSRHRPRGTLPGMSGKHCSPHGSWDTPTPVVETQRWGSFIPWIGLSWRGLHSVWKPATVECKKGRESKQNTCFSELDNQGESQLAARQCSLLRTQKDSYSSQCEAGWDQGMIMSVSERSSVGHE